MAAGKVGSSGSWQDFASKAASNGMRIGDMSSTRQALQSAASIMTGPSTTRATIPGTITTTTTTKRYDSNCSKGHVLTRHEKDIERAGLVFTEKGVSKAKIKVDQDKFKCDCLALGIGWPPKGLKQSKWAKN